MKTWMPQPKQAAMLSSDVEDILFGGARFGGKTDGLLGDFANRARIYGGQVRGILFRRSFPELEEVQARLREALTRARRPHAGRALERAQRSAARRRLNRRTVDSWEASAMGLGGQGVASENTSKREHNLPTDYPASTSGDHLPG